MGGFGLIGRTLAHSFSPAIHAMVGGYDYRLYPLEPEVLADFVAHTTLDGFNVTIPYKQAVLPLCRELSARAAAVGSVNTMLRLPGGGFRGENTDYDGFSALLGADAGRLRGQQTLVLGSGGSAQTVCAVLSDRGIPYTVISRTGADNYQTLHRHGDTALVVNTTPVGMYPHNGESPVDLSLFPECRLVLDLIYNPAKTALLLQAERLGIPARSGLLMLCAQGVRAGELFLGRRLPPTLVADMAARISRQTMNIVLIGMPGCGKSTTARYLSALTGRPMADTDTLVAEAAGMSIPALFERYGEAHFRALETDVLRRVSKESGQIIATGGGVVTVPENRDLIHQNSLCIFLERDKEQLAVADRPLSARVGIDRLYEARLPLYRAWSDAAYRNDHSQTTAEQIRKDLQL
ncbi:MAG: shikimate kinase [Eubacteriales bacterium]